MQNINIILMEENRCNVFRGSPCCCKRLWTRFSLLRHLNIRVKVFWTKYQIINLGWMFKNNLKEHPFIYKSILETDQWQQAWNNQYIYLNGQQEVSASCSEGCCMKNYCHKSSSFDDYFKHKNVRLHFYFHWYFLNKNIGNNIQFNIILLIGGFNNTEKILTSKNVLCTFSVPF